MVLLFAPACVTLFVFALIRAVIHALVGRDEIDPAVYLLDQAILSPEAVPYAMYLVSAVAAPALGFATYVALRRRHRLLLLATPLLAFVGIALSAAMADATGRALEPLVPHVAPDSGATSSLVTTILRTWFVALPFVSLGVLVGAAGGRTRHAVAALAGLAVVEPLMSSLVPRGLARFLLNDNVQSIMRQNGRVSAFEDGRAGRVAGFVANLPGAGPAALVVGVYTAAFVLLALVLTLRTSARGQADSA